MNYKVSGSDPHSAVDFKIHDSKPDPIFHSAPFPAIPGLSHRTDMTIAFIHRADIRARVARSAPRISNRGPGGRCVPGRVMEQQASRNQRARPMTQTRHVEIGELMLGNDRPLVLIAGH